MRHWKTDLQHELSWFLVVYLLVLLSVLLAVHVLQPDLERQGSASQSPIYESYQPTATHALAARGARLRSGAPSTQ